MKNRFLYILSIFIPMIIFNCNNNDEILEDYEQIGKYLYYKNDINILREMISNSCIDSNDNNLFEYTECSIDSIDDENNDGIIDPLEIGFTEWGVNRRLIVLYAPNKGISGKFSENIWDLNKLTKLNLRNNQLSGELPVGIENLSELKELWLDNNMIEGEIYSNFSLLDSLDILSLPNNNFTSISNNLCQTIDSLNYFSLRGNQICNIDTLSDCMIDIVGNNQNCQ